MAGTVNIFAQGDKTVLTENKKRAAARLHQGQGVFGQLSGAVWLKARGDRNGELLGKVVERWAMAVENRGDGRQSLVEPVVEVTLRGGRVKPFGDKTTLFFAKAHDVAEIFRLEYFGWLHSRPGDEKGFRPSPAGLVTVGTAGVAGGQAELGKNPGPVVEPGQTGIVGQGGCAAAIAEFEPLVLFHVLEPGELWHR